MYDKTGLNDLTKAVHGAGLWSPATGTWRKMASNAVSRGYHSTSILLPSGRVLHAGSGDAAAAPNETNAEILNGNGVPSVAKIVQIK